MNPIQVSLAAALMVTVELIYFKIARQFQIVDVPNDRSLHWNPTIRGGGVIFFFAVWIYYLMSQNLSLSFMAGVSLVSVTGFLDDVLDLRSVTRLMVQFLAFIILFYDVGAVTTFGIPLMVFLLIVVIAALNAFNFMDGINGLTGGYSFVVLACILYVNQIYQEVIPGQFLLMLMIALLIFNFFNFRTRALCFAGDVGSTSIAYILIYTILLLIISTGNFSFFLFLAVYGVDSALTIIHRFLRRENIFKAHRLHLYQVIVYHYKLPHLAMSAIYMAVQLLINLMLIYNLRKPIMDQYIAGVIITMGLSVLYILLKWFLLLRLRPV